MKIVLAQSCCRYDAFYQYTTVLNFFYQYKLCYWEFELNSSEFKSSFFQQIKCCWVCGWKNCVELLFWKTKLKIKKMPYKFCTPKNILYIQYTFTLIHWNFAGIHAATAIVHTLLDFNHDSFECLCEIWLIATSSQNLRQGIDETRIRSIRVI